MSPARAAATTDWRAAGLRRMLVVGGMFIAGVTLASVPSVLEGRVSPGFLATVGAVAVVWWLSGALPGLPPRMRLALPVVACVAGVLVSLLELAFAPGPVVAALGTVIITAAFGSLRASLATAALMTGAAVGVGQLVGAGRWTFPPGNPFIEADAFNWSRAGLSAVLLVGLLTTVLRWLLGRLDAELDAERRASEELATKQRERARAEEAQTNAQRALSLSREAEAVGRLAGGIAHDFNNQLQVVLGWAALLRRMEPEARRRLLPEALDDLRRAADRSAELSRRLVTTSASQTQEPGVTDCDAFIEAQLRSLRTLLPADVELRFRGGSGLSAHLRESAFHQVLMNLVLNARDALPEGGVIHVTTRAEVCTATPQGKPSSVCDGAVVLEVHDGGVGMDEETLARVFEPFFTTKGGGGAGLGLANVYGLASSAGGSVEVQSAPGRGTTVTVRLPGAARAAPTPTRAPRGRPRGTGVVLVVDDRDDVRGVLVRVLRDAGYVVADAHDAQEAIDRVERADAPIDLLVTDAIMPGRSVLDLISAFRARFPGGVVMVCSGHVEEELLRRGIRSGDYRFLAKPFDADALLSRVTETLGAPESS